MSRCIHSTTALRARDAEIRAACPSDPCRTQALRIKKDNWSQLLKFFRKAGIADVITRDEVNQIIHCEDGAVVKFVNRMYETLTQCGGGVENRCWRLLETCLLRGIDLNGPASSRARHLGMPSEIAGKARPGTRRP